MHKYDKTWAELNGQSKPQGKPQTTQKLSLPSLGEIKPHGLLARVRIAFWMWAGSDDELSQAWAKAK